MSEANISFLIVLLLYKAQIKKMTFARIFMISLLCYKGLINCQSKPKRVLFKEFFNYDITVDYNSCNHPFYDEYEYEGYEEEEYDDDICLRYNVLN